MEKNKSIFFLLQILEFFFGSSSVQTGLKACCRGGFFMIFIVKKLSFKYKYIRKQDRNHIIYMIENL